MTLLFYFIRKEDYEKVKQSREEEHKMALELFEKEHYQELKEIEEEKDKKLRHEKTSKYWNDFNQFFREYKYKNPNVPRDLCDKWHFIGTSAGGWSFAFSPDFLEVWKELKDNRWYKYKLYMTDEESVDEEELDENDIWNLLSNPDYIILDEDELIYTYQDFQKKVQDKGEGFGNRKIGNLGFHLNMCG